MGEAHARQIDGEVQGMRFSLSHERMVIGHRITAKVSTASDEAITRVLTKLDGRKLGDDKLSPAEVQYVRVFEQVGGAGPSQDHVLLVSATNDDGATQTASLRWTDTI
jgi:hypothetical protein